VPTILHSQFNGAPSSYFILLYHFNTYVCVRVDAKVFPLEVSRSQIDVISSFNSCSTYGTANEINIINSAIVVRKVLLF